MLGVEGFRPCTAWSFDLYGGTVLLAARRNGDGTDSPDESVRALLAEEVEAGVADPVAVGALQHDMQSRAGQLRDWLVTARDAGDAVIGYGAASRAVALLVRADVDRTLLPAVVDASPAKQGLRMPGTDIPIVEPSELAVGRPNVLVFVPDLMGEVQAAFPQVEAVGGRWVDAEALGA
jgi:hypothetical protein